MKLINYQQIDSFEVYASWILSFLEILMEFYERIVITDSAFFLEILVKPSYVRFHYVGLKNIVFLQSVDSLLDIAKGYGLLNLLFDLFYLIKCYHPISVLGSLSD